MSARRHPLLVAVALLSGAGCVQRSSADAAAEIVREEADFVADSTALAARVRLDTVTAVYVAHDPGDEDEGIPPSSTWRHVGRRGDFCDADARRALPGDTLRCPWTTLAEVGLAAPTDDGFAPVEPATMAAEDAMRRALDSMRAAASPGDRPPADVRAGDTTGRETIVRPPDSRARPRP